MKRLITVTTVAGIAGGLLPLITACQTTGSSQAGPQKEALLAQSGFKAISVTTATQQQAVSNLAQGRVSAVKHNGKLYYV